MMKGICSSKEDGFHVFYSTSIQEARLVLLPDARKEIVLVYDEFSIDEMRAVVCEMNRREIFPELYYGLQNPSDVTIVFRFRGPSLELMTTLELDAHINTALLPEMHFIAMAESCFEIKSLLKYIVPSQQNKTAITLVINDMYEHTVIATQVKQIRCGEPTRTLI